MPASSGAYAKLVGNSESVFGEIDITSRSKIAVSAFYVKDRGDFGTIKITKLKFHKTFGWQEDGHVQVNHFQVAQMKEFIAIISSLDLRDAKKTRISPRRKYPCRRFGCILLSSTKGAALYQELATNPELHQDIYAISAKRTALTEFETKLLFKNLRARLATVF